MIDREKYLYQLLVKYMHLVMSEEHCSYVSNAQTPLHNQEGLDFSPDELKDLQKIQKELNTKIFDR